METKSEHYFFSPDNFLFVMRKMFPAVVLRKARERISLVKKQATPKDNRSRKGEEFGVAPDVVRLDKQWYDIWKHADRRVMEAYIPDYTELIFPPQIRTVRNHQAFVPWHQDLTYMKSLGSKGHVQVITCFIPLDEDPANRSSLEFAVNPDQEPIDAVIIPNTAFNQFDIHEKDIPSESLRHVFDLNLGDAFVFGKLVLHRTFQESEMVAERNSFEFRLTTPSTTIPGKDYFSLKSMHFYLKEKQ